MYAEAGLQFPFLQGELTTMASAQLCHQQQFFPVGLPDGAGSNVLGMQIAVVSEYDLGGEGDLFKAPEPVIEEPVLSPMAAAISMISGGGDVIAETINAADIESIQNVHLSDILYQCEKDLLEKSAIEESISELLDVTIPAVQTDEVPNANKHCPEGPLQKSISFGCLSSIGNDHGCAMRPNFLEFQGLDFEVAFGMRRACSEGDIQNLTNKSTRIGNTSIILSSFDRLLTLNDLKTEERRQKLSRYWKKKSERNFSRKIKYACRKALADSQPRVRGRFARTDECEASKRSKLMPAPN